MLLLLLDLDGTIRRPKSGAKFISKPLDQEIIPEAKAALTDDFIMHPIGITNQAGIAAGHKSLEDAIAEQRETLRLVPTLSQIIFCPDFEGSCAYIVHRDGSLEKYTHSSNPQFDSFRKPGAGMLQLAMQIGKVRPKDCLMITSVRDKGNAIA